MTRSDGHARLVPVGEQHRKRAVARRQRGRVLVVRLVAGMRTEEVIVGAGPPRRAGRHAVDIVADGERREGLARLPGGREGRRPVLAAVEGEGAVGDLELAVRLAFEDQVAAEPEHDEIHDSVIVDVERIGADDVGQVFVRDAHRHFFELERPAGRALVAVELRRVGAAGDEEIGKAIAVAVERRHAAADEELPRAGIGMVDAGGDRLLVHVGDVVRHGARCRRPAPCAMPSPAAKRAGEERAPDHCWITSVFRKAIRSERSASSAAI